MNIIRRIKGWIFSLILEPPRVRAEDKTPLAQIADLGKIKVGNKKYQVTAYKAGVNSKESLQFLIQKKADLLGVSGLLRVVDKKYRLPLDWNYFSFSHDDYEGSFVSCFYHHPLKESVGGSLLTHVRRKNDAILCFVEVI